MRNSVVGGRVDRLRCRSRIQRRGLDATVVRCGGGRLEMRRRRRRRRLGHVICDDQMNAQQHGHERAVEQEREPGQHVNAAAVDRSKEIGIRAGKRNTANYQLSHVCYLPTPETGSQSWRRPQIGGRNVNVLVAICQYTLAVRPVADCSIVFSAADLS